MTILPLSHLASRAREAADNLRSLHAGDTSLDLIGLRGKTPEATAVMHLEVLLQILDQVAAESVDMRALETERDAWKAHAFFWKDKARAAAAEVPQ